MTPSELEVVVRNHDLRLSRLEQILPTLVMKDDMETGFQSVRRDMAAGFDTLRQDFNGLKVQIEEMRESIGIIAAHLADTMQRRPRRSDDSQ